MSLQTISYRMFRVVRRTDVLVSEQPVEASVSNLLAFCPSTAAQVEVVLRGSGGLTGTVTISGELNGSPVSETLTFSGPISGTYARVQTCQLFDCVTSITTTGLADETPAPTIEARYRSEGNQAVPVNQEILDCLVASREPISAPAGRWITQTHSTESEEDALGFEDLYGYEPATGDLLVELNDLTDSGKIWEVQGEIQHLGSLWSRTYEMRVLLRKAADVTVRPAP